MLGGAPHNELEPHYFDAGWVGREAMDVLNRARKRKFKHAQTVTGTGYSCLVFHNDRMVRRMMNQTSGKPR